MSVGPLNPLQLDAHAQLERDTEERAKRERLAVLDQKRAARAERLHALVEGKPVPNVWAEDLLPVIDELYQVAHRKLIEESDTSRIPYCQALQDVVKAVGGHIELGKASIYRLAQQRLGKEHVLPRRR